MLSDLIKDHMANPRNRGEMASPDGVGDVVGPVCGDRVTVYIKTSAGYIQEIRFTTYGCWAAVAMGSLMTEMAKGQRLEAVLEMDARQLALEAAGLPEDKVICSELVMTALRGAVLDCQSRL